MAKIRESNVLNTLITELKDVVSDTTPQLGGNLDTQSFTVDGRDVSTDGTKLDTIATTATANPNAINNVVEDTTPQLGGDLDVNGNDIVSTSNADINITANGTGRVTLGPSKIQQVAEKITTAATAATGTVAYDVLTQAVLNYTTAASGNWTLNVRGDGSTALNAVMDTGESLTIAFIVAQTGTADYNNVFQIDGSGVTPEWQGGAAPTEGNINSLDTYSYTIIKTGSATFTVLASQTQFA